jgi:Predicted membrane protein (DUF2207) C-terminal domain
LQLRLSTFADLSLESPGLLDVVVFFAPALLVLGAIVLLFGPDPATTYDRPYEESPPTNTPPAFVPPLLRRAVTPEANEFTATLFDLIRRGYFVARVVPADGSANELTRDEPTDLELSSGNRDVALADFEVPVARVFDGVVSHGPTRLSRVHDHLEEKSENVLRFDIFRDEVKSAIDARGWYTFTAARVLLLASAAFFALGMVGSGLLYPASRTATFYYGATMIDGAAVLFHASWITKLIRRRRRTPEGQLEAKRWEAFRRYLTDFPRLRDAPAATLELWESYLVYAIALGIADRVLAGAEAYRLEELSRSPVFWLGLQENGSADAVDPYSRLAARMAPDRSRRARYALTGTGRR